MKSKFLMGLIILCILFSITAVSASDNQTEVSLNQESISNDYIDVNHGDFNEKLETATKSYDDFYNDIKNCTGLRFDIKSNYKYDENDSKMLLEINQSNLVINGNNHIIDGSNKARGFNFISEISNITINNLTFINCNQSIVISGKLTLNNVNFTNNFANPSRKDSGIINTDFDSDLTLNHCNFNSNFDTYLIYASETNVEIFNSHFYNTRSRDAPILVNRNALVIENSTFENLSSRYGGVINFKGNFLSVKNSTFKNDHADLTGGAILGKLFRVFSENSSSGMPPVREWIIENCEFVNVSSIHNGGAIYFDFDSGEPGVTTTLYISNSNFTDISSGYGGVIASQGGILYISNSNFVNSKAKNIGGAIYTSWANLTLVNCNIINNSAQSNAAAIYFDYGKLFIDKSNFINNTVTVPSSGNESVIYANDVTATINNSTFKNGGVAIYANFASDDSIIKDIISTDLFLLNNTDYIVSVENKGIKINLTKNSLVVDKLPARFDARDWGWASPLKYQGDNLACWAFATAGALECALLKQTGVLYNVSEDNIQNIQLKYYPEGDTRNAGVGVAYSGLGHSLSWYGVVTAQDDPYDARGMFSSVVQTENRIHLQDAMIIFGGRNDTMDLIKQAVINYGAVSIQFNYLSFDYNRTNYTDQELQPSHFVTLIGWDDNYAAENFNGSDAIATDALPKGDGAWLIKDSENEFLSETEGTYMGEGGYMWLSYYNPSFLAKDFRAIIPQAAAVAYIFENTIDYHVNYQTDLMGLCGFDGDYTYYSNEFTSKYSELIGAVGTYFNESGIDYSFDVYVNGVKVHSQSGVSEFVGFRTIVLNKYIPVNSGDKFKVVFKNNNLPFQAYSRQHYVPGMSLISKDGNTWSDISLENKTVCLKVYTVMDDTKIANNKDISVDYGGGYFTVKVVTDDGRDVGAGEKVKFTINGKTVEVKTNSDGIAKIKITDVPGKYTITTDYNGKTYKNTVTVKFNLKTCKVVGNKDIKVDYDGGKYFTVKVISADGKVVASGAIVKFNINKKTMTVKTDKKGIAKVKITDIPGKYSIKTILNGKTYTNKVTVKQVLKAKKAKVKKTAKKFTLKATLKINGKLIKGKKIKFKFKGKTYKAKTNKKGMAKVKVKKNVIKKLKKGKKYTVKVTYLKDTIKTTVKVK